MTFRAALALAVLTFVASGCFSQRPAKSPDAYENFNEDEYSRVQSSSGSGAESSGAYYGSQGSSPPARTPAQPAVGGSGR
jgi:outer membrane lipoprotein-sorting protein